MLILLYAHTNSCTWVWNYTLALMALYVSLFLDICKEAVRTSILANANLCGFLNIWRNEWESSNYFQVRYPYMYTCI